MLAASARHAAAAAPATRRRRTSFSHRRAVAVSASSSSSSSSSSPSYRFDAIDAEWHALPKPAVARATAVRRGSERAAAANHSPPRTAHSELVERLNAALGIQPQPQQHQSDVFIITFGGGAGVYTLSSSSSSSSSPSSSPSSRSGGSSKAANPTRETVLAFEAADDAERYATLLEAVLPDDAPGPRAPSPEVFALPRADVDAFCRAGGYALCLHPSAAEGGALLLPPEATLRLMFDLEDLQQQKGPAQDDEEEQEEVAVEPHQEPRRWSSSA